MHKNSNSLQLEPFKLAAVPIGKKRSPLTKIKARINNLKKTLLEPNKDAQLLNRLILTYTQSVIKRLDFILCDDDPSTIINGFDSMLKENWELINASLLCYTALPDHNITQLLCDIAKYVSAYKRDERSAAINILMPTVACNSLFPTKYPNLDSEELQTILKTYILSDNSKYLIPVSFLTNIEIETLLNSNNTINSYYEWDDDSNLILTDAEIKRLATLTNETKAIFDAFNKYKLLIDNPSLLEQLYELIRALDYKSLDGIDEENYAGKSVYTTIQNFVSYLSLLDLETLKSIPDAATKEIATLINMASGQEPPSSLSQSLEIILSLHNAVVFEKIENKADKIGLFFDNAKDQLIDSYLASYGGNLQQLTERIGDELYAIKLTKEIKMSRAQEILMQFETAKETLKTRLNNNEYLGRDPLGITTKLLRGLTIDLVFESFPILISSLKGITTEEIAAICALQEAPKKIVNAIATVKNLITLFRSFNNEIMRSLINGTMTEIKTIIKSAEDFSTLIKTLEKKQCVIICDTLKEYLPSLIKTAQNFNVTLQCLTTEKRTIVYKELKETLPSLIKKGEDFGLILQYLTTEQCITLCTALKEQLPSSVKNGAFSKALQALTTEQCIAVCMTLKEQLPLLIKDVTELGKTPQALTVQQCNTVCTVLKEQLPLFITSSTEFNKALQKLTPEYRTVLYATIKEQLFLFVTSGSDFSEVIQYLSSEERIDFYNQFKEKNLFSLIKSGSCFAKFLLFLPSAQRTDTYEQIEAKLPSLIKNSYDFNNIIHYLTPDQYKAVCTALKKISWPLNNIKNFYEVFNNMTVEQRAITYEQFKEDLLSSIKYVEEFCAVLERFEYKAQQRIDVYEKFKGKLPILIKNVEDFDRIVKLFTGRFGIQQRVYVYEQLKERLPSFIKNSNHFNLVLKHLNVKQRTEVYERLKEKLPSFIKNSSHFNLVLEHLIPQQCTYIYEQLQGALPYLIKNGEDFNNVLQFLTTDQRTTLYELLKEVLPLIIKNGEDFCKALQYLNEGQYIAVCIAIKEQRPLMIQDDRDFGEAFKPLSSEHRRIISEIFQQPKHSTRHTDAKEENTVGQEVSIEHTPSHSHFLTTSSTLFKSEPANLGIPLKISTAANNI